MAALAFRCLPCPLRPLLTDFTFRDSSVTAVVSARTAGHPKTTGNAQRDAKAQRHNNVADPACAQLQRCPWVVATGERRRVAAGCRKMVSGGTDGWVNRSNACSALSNIFLCMPCKPNAAARSRSSPCASRCTSDGTLLSNRAEMNEC